MKLVLSMAVAFAAVVMLWAWFARPSQDLTAVGEAQCTNVVIDWVQVFQVNGARYYISPENRDASPRLGPEIARVQYNVRANVCDPYYRLKDGDATFLPEGTSIYRVDTYRPEQVLAAAGQVYEARPEGGVVGADQLPFRDGVQRIAILSNFDASEEASIDEADLIDAVVTAALAAPVEGETAGDWDHFLEFEMEDGLRFRRSYNSLTGNMRDGVRLPEAAQEIIRDALRGGR